jgi:hypothetical protein
VDCLAGKATLGPTAEHKTVYGDIGFGVTERYGHNVVNFGDITVRPSLHLGEGAESNVTQKEKVLVLKE